MFIIAQLIGLAVTYSYLPQQETILNQTTGQLENVSVSPLPPGFQPPEVKTNLDFWTLFTGIIFSFVIAIIIIFVLSRIRVRYILKYWFFVVVIIAIGLALNAVLKSIPLLSEEIIPGTISLSFLLSLIIGIPLAVYKIFKRNLIVHNLTELIIYPGIAAVFVSLFNYQQFPLANVIAVSLFLIIISVYDMWAVWKSQFMQKMAKFQINELKIFSGFFVPYLSKRMRAKIKEMKKSKRGKKIRVSLAILGGGDVVFPIITSGVFLKFYGLVPALFVTIGATLGLLYLFSISEKKKFYPAMPFITGGIFLALLLWLLISFLF
jgi:presenilin-like A22 family membrane protease